MSRPTLGIRARVLALQAVLISSVLMVGLAAALVLQVTSWTAKRTGFAQAQLQAWAEVAASANSYSEQIAELLLLGEGELPEIDRARTAIEDSLRNLSRATSGEFTFLAGDAARQAGESEDVARYAKVRELYRDVDRMVEQILTLRALGRLPEAVTMLREEVDGQLDVELDKLIAEGIEDEHEEVREEEAAAARYRRLVGAGTAAAVSLALAGTLLVGRSLHRRLVPPIMALADGAEALGRGDLTRRVAVAGSVLEIETLAERFNAMAAHIEDQQGRLTRNRAELELEVQRRTGQLEVANQQLREVDQTRIRFLGDLSHELRTPLTVLRGEAEVAMRGEPTTARQAAALEVIMRQAMQMEQLVSDLLFLARSDSKADVAPLDARPVVLQELLLEVVEDVLTLAQAPESSIVDEAWPEEPIQVRVDPLRLKQALMIVLDNALKYSPPTRPVRVGIKQPEDGGWAEAVVVNEGSGLMGTELPQAFDRFFRGRNARTGQAPGSGLGLPIAKSIVERHGGTISIDSAPAGPTRVSIRLPATVVDHV